MIPALQESLYSVLWIYMYNYGENLGIIFMIIRNCIGEGNGTPLQYFCLENPMDGGAWLAAIYGVAQSQTQLKRLSSSSNSIS